METALVIHQAVAHLVTRPVVARLVAQVAVLLVPAIILAEVSLALPAPSVPLEQQIPGSEEEVVVVEVVAVKIEEEGEEGEGEDDRSGLQLHPITSINDFRNWCLLFAFCFSLSGCEFLYLECSAF